MLLGLKEGSDEEGGGSGAGGGREGCCVKQFMNLTVPNRHSSEREVEAVDSSSGESCVSSWSGMDASMASISSRDPPVSNNCLIIPVFFLSFLSRFLRCSSRKLS